MVAITLPIKGLEGLSWDVWYAKGDDAEEIVDFKRR